jgi:membrane protease YdiL (CAAX protease family)
MKISGNRFQGIPVKQLKMENRWSIRDYLVTLGAPTVGFFIVYLIEMFLNIDLPRLIMSLFNLVVTSFFAFYVLPRKRGVPFGKVATSEFLHRLGIIRQEKIVGHILIGVILATLSLSGMLIGSMLSGLYAFDPSTVDVSQIIFSINPGLWEELFYRGALMGLLIRDTKSLRTATLIQVGIFSLLHVKGLDLWSLMDVFSVSILTLGFTYTAYKTRSLIPGIIYHFLHDAFLFVVQVPREVALSNTQNAVFFVSLWVAVGVGCLISKVSVERFGIQEKEELYKI